MMTQLNLSAALILFAIVTFFHYLNKRDKQERLKIEDQMIGFLDMNSFIREFSHTYSNSKCSVYIKGREVTVETHSGSFKHHNQQVNLYDASLFELVGYLVYNKLIEKDFKH